MFNLLKMIELVGKKKWGILMYVMDLTGKVAIVTGGARGIGKAIVNALLECGAQVAVIDLAPSPESLHEKILYFQADITESSIVNGYVDQTVKHFGRLDILVNNAGISSMDYVVDIKEEDWDRVLDVNAKSVYLWSQAVAQYLIKQGQGGKIINIASQAGKNGYRLMGSYVASKHAVMGFTKVMALELAKHAINVNAVCPGIVETDMKRSERVIGGQLRGLNAHAIEMEDISQVPLGRTAKPEDVANVVIFLTSRFSDYMTGQGVNVTGGMTMS
ncbi:SDR family NAD(P)-dependent oxidoreductase [Sutcliffiella sp. NC1]|uniref:SDR family NAD(P)-dependent oxidoreductase n=1 Tax=Sutcliffiella sp. NC1 TaxID=3004096 RepID=UPI0022DD8AAD|nr:SDR family NAD(P)-dependent oxidoreductase [Sutcliffiella sp. NC1]WBL16851.1 SDR family NAD(P)-dependent oxidoreductase [Sutcliffiella sp. NC1]